jgi:hypothetical protein
MYIQASSDSLLLNLNLEKYHLFKFYYFTNNITIETVIQGLTINSFLIV